MFYKYISENISKYINEEERKLGNKDMIKLWTDSKFLSVVI